MNNNFERILVIIDHVMHATYIEYVSKEDLDKYDGDEQKYIDATYTFEGDYSWDWVVDVELIRPDKEQEAVAARLSLM